MTDYFTTVEGAMYASRGQRPRGKAIAEARSYAEHQRAKWAAVCEHLAKPNDELVVMVVRGAVKEEFVRYASS